MTHSESMPLVDSWENTAFKSAKRILLCVFVVLFGTLCGLVIPIIFATWSNIIHMLFVTSCIILVVLMLVKLMLIEFKWNMTESLNSKVNGDGTLIVSVEKNIVDEIDFNFYVNKSTIDTPVATKVDVIDGKKIPRNLWSQINIHVYDIVQELVIAKFSHDSYEIIIFEWFLCQKIEDDDESRFEEINVTCCGNVIFGKDSLGKKFLFTIVMILVSYLVGLVTYLSSTWYDYFKIVLNVLILIAVCVGMISCMHSSYHKNVNFWQTWPKIKDSVKYVVLEVFDTILPSIMITVLRYCMS